MHPCLRRSFIDFLHGLRYSKNKFLQGGTGMYMIDSVFHTPDEAELSSPLYLTWAGRRICRPDHAIGPRVLPNYKSFWLWKEAAFFICVAWIG